MPMPKMGKDDPENSESEIDPLGFRERSTNRSIPERVAQFYYFLGLFCSSYSAVIITATISIALVCCYPILSLPLPGNRPQYFSTPYSNYSVPSLSTTNNDLHTTENWPRWYKDLPHGPVVQQILVKSSVFPWNENLILTDAFRGPLSESFRFLQTIKNIRPSNKTDGLPELCFHVGEVKSKALKGKYAMLPEYACLIVAPPNFWQENYSKFLEDPDILATILNYRSHQKGKSGLAELLLGMNVKETGLKRYPFRSRQRIVSYAVTIVFSRFDSTFIDHLRNTLQKSYPSSSTSSKPGENITESSSLSSPEQIIHIFYPSQSSLLELIPLVCTYVVMFLYVYFSVKKVEMIKSKLGVAFSALVTVVVSLCMSVGLCSHFGMSYEINAKAIFPYLVVVIGLENILVLTRSVVSTASHLDVKIRVAQGLSKEGWSITKNLLAEVTILTIGFFTFIPRIQEFCILAVVGLLSDFFLQTFFFATVLSIDIRRSEFSTISKHYSSPYAPFRTPVHPSLNRVKSNPRINGHVHKNGGGTVSVVAPSQSTPILIKLPKRVRLVYFWAKTRFFQRTFIIFMVGWISFIIYESGIVAHFGYEAEDVVIPMDSKNYDGNRTGGTPVSLSLSLSRSNRIDSYVVNRTLLKNYRDKPLPLSPETTIQDLQNEKLRKELNEPNTRAWRRLSQFHWQVLLGVYNVSLNGKYISILPPICVTIPVDPNLASSIRHPHEHEEAKKFNWQALTNAFEPIDFADEYDTNIPSVTVSPTGKGDTFGFFYSWEDGREIPYIPTSPIELALTVLLALPSLTFITYMIVVFYKCICTRNYAEWRSNLFNKKERQEYYTEVVFEAVPLVLEGHTEEVECMGNDGNTVASVCLSGVLKIWNATTGDNIITVNRRRYFDQLNELEDLNFLQGGSDGDSSIAGSSPPSQGNTSNVFETRPLFLNRPMRYSHPQFPPYYNPDSPIPQYSPPLQQNHIRNGSIGGSIFTYQDSVVHSTHRRTSSFPNQNQGNFTHSQPIDVPPESMNRFPSREQLYLNLSNQIRGPDTATTNSRVGSPLEKINEGSYINPPSVWCLDCQENLVVLGTGTGRVEIWDASTGHLKCIYDDNCSVGIMCLKLIGNRLVTARINGSLDFLEIESPGRSRHHGGSDSPSIYSRWQVGNEGENRSSTYTLDTEIRCAWLTTLKAHQQPITCLESEGGRILTGSQDHCLKVFRLEDHLPMYTLHGHYGPITCLFIDKISPMTSGSGSQDGMLCVWDLLTGLCEYSTQAHDGPISALTYSASYIISAGGDNKICVWERFQGHLLNTIQLNHTYCSSLVMLTHNLLVSSKQGSLVVWDVRSGDIVRIVRLGHRDNTVFVRGVTLCGDGILCDYGSSLRLVRFPSIVTKVD